MHSSQKPPPSAGPFPNVLQTLRAYIVDFLIVFTEFLALGPDVDVTFPRVFDGSDLWHLFMTRRGWVLMLLWGGVGVDSAPQSASAWLFVVLGVAGLRLGGYLTLCLI